jgi:hypothetical protein
MIVGAIAVLDGGLELGSSIARDYPDARRRCS